MRSFILAAILAVAASSHAASTKPEVTEKVSVNQLEQSLSLVHGKSDADMAQALSTLELTDRLSGVRLAHLEANLPGEKAQRALLIVADQSVFLPPPDDEIVADPAPDAAATRQMLVKIVAYVNTTVRQLPNLMAVRETTSFQDRPAEDRVDATGTLSLGYLPVHFMGKSALAVTYRDRKEVVDESATKALKHGTAVGGLATSGEFGPILSTVLADAIKGTITWARWEQGTAGRVAVFHYAVPDQKSNYNVEFCCIANGFRGDGQPDMQVFDERAAYHGEIAFNAADGSILRLTLEAEMPPAGLVPHAGIAIEYSSVEIGGRDYICPAKSVSILQAHTAMPQGTESRSKYKGPAKTFLNDVAFKDYRRFGSETHILAGYDQAPEK
jgi:hypothetical protein